MVQRTRGGTRRVHQVSTGRRHLSNKVKKKRPRKKYYRRVERQIDKADRQTTSEPYPVVCLIQRNVICSIIILKKTYIHEVAFKGASRRTRRAEIYRSRYK